MKPRLRRDGLRVTTTLTVTGVPDSRRFLATAEPATGIVVRVEERVSRERIGSGENAYWTNVTRYFPFVEFRTAREQVVQFQADDGSLRVGESVRVVYDPANPRTVRLDKWGNRWAGPLAFGGGGVVLFVINGAVYLLLPPWGEQRRTR
jgi:hypothetical protein